MAFWSGEKLATRRSVVDGFDDKHVDCNAYNLHMGDVYYRTGEHETGYEQKKTSLKEREALLIPPGQFAFLLTKEIIRIPSDAMAFISMKTGIKFQGLINVSGFHVDPGYEGKLIYAVYNASPSPIQIGEGDPIFKIWFCDLSQVSADPYIFKGAGNLDISTDLMKGMNKEIYSLQSLADKIRDQQIAIDAKLAEQKPVIDNLTFIWRTAVMGVIGAVVIAFLTLSLPSIYRLGGIIATYRSSSADKQSSALPQTNQSPMSKTAPPSTGPAPPK
jgi:dCTP deaminase